MSRTSKISLPSLSICGAHNTMDPKHMEWISIQVQNGRYLHCSNGSHMSFYDAQQTCFKGLIQFLKDVDKGEGST